MTRIWKHTLALVGALSIGCAGPTLMQRADTLAPGRVQGSVGANLGATYDGVAIVPLPMVAASIRVGVADTVDVGLTAWSIGGRIDTKLRLFQDDRLTFSTALGVEASLLPRDSLATFGVQTASEDWSLGAWSLPILFQLEEHDFAFIVGVPLSVGYATLGTRGSVFVDTGLAVALDVYTERDAGFFVQLAALTRAGPQIDRLSLLAGEDAARIQLLVGGYFGNRR